MAPTSSPIYKRLPPEDESEPLVEGSSSNEDPIHRDHGGRFISLNRFLVLQVGILIIFTLVTVAINTRMVARWQRATPSSDMLVPYLKTKEFTYTQSPELSNMSHDFDQDFLLATSPIHGEGMAWLSFNDTSRRNWGVAMFHALHCLRILRTKLQSSLANASTDAIPGHTGHCFDYIAQHILCTGDSTLEVPVELVDPDDKKEITPVDGVGSTHHCKDTSLMWEVVNMSYYKTLQLGEWQWQRGATLESVLQESGMLTAEGELIKKDSDTL